VTTAAGIVVAVVIVLLHQALKSMLGQAVLEVQLLVEEAAEHLTRTRDGAKARRDREEAADGG
jgi:biopolymer transport protein ExbB/TolQ